MRALEDKPLELPLVALASGSCHVPSAGPIFPPQPTTQSFEDQRWRMFRLACLGAGYGNWQEVGSFVEADNGISGPSAALDRCGSGGTARDGSLAPEHAQKTTVDSDGFGGGVRGQ